MTDNHLLVLATISDPRFKDKFFHDSSERRFARRLLEEKRNELLEAQSTSESYCADSAEDTLPPSPKRPRSALWDSLQEILEETGCRSESSAAALTDIDQYLSEPVIDFHRTSCYSWWRENSRRFSLLSKLAQRYLSAPATSVPSERLFSDAGNICSDKRNRLASERTETLLFIKNNFDLYRT